MNAKQELLKNPAELKRLYLDERLTTREIGKLYGCSKHPVMDALKELDIETRSIRTKGTKPSYDQLRKWVEIDHLTLSEIAKRTGAHYTGVRWWIEGYGIEWENPDAWSQRNKQRDFREPDEADLAKWYCEDMMSLDAIAEKVGVTRQLIADRLNRYGIESRAPGWSHKTFGCNDGHIVKSTYELRVDNWLFSNGIPHVYEYPLPALGGTSSADFKVGNTFIEVWGVMDSPRYDARKKVKTAWYSDNGHALISINYWDFSSQSKGRWKRKLQTLL